MSAVDLVALWIGRGVLVAGALSAALCVVIGLNAIVGWLFWHHVRKNGFSADNWHSVAEWVENGKPVWTYGEDRVYRMMPSEKRRRE